MLFTNLHIHTYIIAYVNCNIFLHFSDGFLHHIYSLLIFGHLLGGIRKVLRSAVERLYDGGNLDHPNCHVIQLDPLLLFAHHHRCETFRGPGR